MQKTLVGAVVACVVLAAAAVSTQQKTSLARAGSGTFVWHDLATTDPAASRAFYGALFGWTFEAGEGVDPGYTIIRQGDRPIGGIVLLKQPDAVAQWLSYVVVSDVDQATEAFRKSGGRVYRGPLNARKDLRVSVVADAQGAPIGLASRGPRLDDESPPEVNRWLWMEYVARDPDAALKFYGDVVGFTNKVSEVKENFTYFLLATDRPRAGLFRSPWERETSVWLPYVRVADPAALAARAVQLGGSVVLEPRPNVRNGSLAIVLDPTGAPLALQKYPFAAGVRP
jgi:predicted enzyme related to lactoylglutathione lyase